MSFSLYEHPSLSKACETGAICPYWVPCDRDWYRRRTQVSDPRSSSTSVHLYILRAKSLRQALIIRPHCLPITPLNSLDKKGYSEAST